MEKAHGANVEQRLRSYVTKKWIHKEGPCSAMNMAKAGFICTSKASAKCYYCEKELEEWEENDDPWKEHMRSASWCPFVKKYVTPPDPSKFTIVESVELEKEKVLLMLDRKYEDTRSRIEQIFENVEKEARGKKLTHGNA